MPLLLGTQSSAHWFCLTGSETYHAAGAWCQRQKFLVSQGWSAPRLRHWHINGIIKNTTSVALGLATNWDQLRLGLSCLSAIALGNGSAFREVGANSQSVKLRFAYFMWSMSHKYTLHYSDATLAGIHKSLLVARLLPAIITRLLIRLIDATSNITCLASHDT